MVRHFMIPRGLWILVWKGWLQSWRGLDIRGVISWLALFSLSVGMLLARGWVTLIWVFIIWGLLISQVCPKRFVSDLSLWAIFRQLPFSGLGILLADVASSVIGATLLIWLAYGLCSLGGWQTNIPVTILAPGMILCLTLTAAFDILRLSKTEALLAGNPAHMGAVGLYLGLILAGLPLALVTWLSGWAGVGITLWISSAIGLLISLGIAYIMWQLATSRFGRIK